MMKINKIIKNIYYGFILFVMFYEIEGMATETIPSNLLAGWNVIRQSQLRQDVSYLASDQLQGRMTLDAGDELAIQWIMKQFKIAGLKPANGNSFLQPISLIEYIPDSQHSYIVLNAKDKKISWRKPDVFTEFRRNIDVTSEVIFAGYGITAPDLRYDDYQHIDVHGKIVLIFEHEPQERNAASIFNGTANTIFATNRIKALNAQNHGAIAVLIAPEPNRKHPSNQERYKLIGGSTARKIPLPSIVLKEDELHIPIAILSDSVAKRIAGNEISLSQLQAEIDSDLKPRSILIPNVKITIHDKIKSQKQGISNNVVGLLEGSDPTLKNETIIISAHHDHDGKSGKEIWHGADDNASGTAGVVTLSRAMMVNSQSPAGLKPKRSILFVVFAAEERGLLGAFYMSAHPLRPLNTTRAMINFDMIGRNEESTPQTNGLINIPADTTNRLNLIGSHYSPDYQLVVMNKNKYVGLTLDNRFDSENALNVFFRSDQFPFVLQNIPAFWWFTGFHPDYHQTTDTVDKINFVKMQKILRLAFLSAYEFANERTKPAFIKNPGLK